MAIAIGFLLRGTAWTIAAYGIGQALRLGTNIVLARLLSPELFGMMLIVYSLRIGIELISDVGIGQNIIYSKDAENPSFYNTAWSLQLIRSLVLWLVFLMVAAPVAQFYHSPILAFVIPIAAFNFVLSGLTSIGRPLLQKQLKIVKLNVFDTIIQFISSVAHVLLAYVSPTIWALVFGGLIGSVASTIGSYSLLPAVKQRFFVSKEFAWQILSFGKWIFVSSIVYFLSTYIDRLYLGKVVPLEVLGIYGIARSISDLSSNLFLQLGNVVLFPFISSHSQTPRAELLERLAPIRAKFLLAAVLGFSFLVSTADLAISILYDQRYHAATWIVPVLIIGSWFSMLATINESTLLGLGKPSYTAISSSSKLIFLMIGLPLGASSYGLFGGVVVVALSDLWRYIPILIGQRRERFSYVAQDLLLTVAVFLLIGLLEWLRWTSGFGTSFDSLPIETGLFFRGGH